MWHEDQSSQIRKAECSGCFSTGIDSLLFCTSEKQYCNCFSFVFLYPGVNCSFWCQPAKWNSAVFLHIFQLSTMKLWDNISITLLLIESPPYAARRAVGGWNPSLPPLSPWTANTLSIRLMIYLYWNTTKN